MVRCYSLLMPILRSCSYLQLLCVHSPCAASLSHLWLKIVRAGGKTTSMERIRGFLSERGFRVYTVPEAATILLSNGLSFADFNTEDKVLDFQTAILKTQIHLEDSFEMLARAVAKPAVLLCDRGAMDGSAYCSPESWQKLMSRMSTSSVELREGRYNAVFHLESAAAGAEAFYTNAGGHRLESAEQARELDQKVLAAWVGHHQLTVFDNDSVETFEDKLRAVVSTLAQLVRLPSSTRRCRKFLLSEAQHEHAGAGAMVGGITNPHLHPVRLLPCTRNLCAPVRCDLI